MNRAVFLDRDNTLIHNDGDLGDPDQVRLIQGAASAIASLRGLGYRIVVVTNQGGVARGKFTEADVERVHARLAELIKTASNTHIDRFYFCPHHPDASDEKYRHDHPWRKPQPGMLKQAAIDLKLDLASSWMVGDAMRDIGAGHAAGTRTILLADVPEGQTPPELTVTGKGGVKPDFIVRSLVEAVRIIAQAPRPEREADASPGPAATKPSPPTSSQNAAQSTPRVVASTIATAPRPAAAPSPNPLHPKTKPPPTAAAPEPSSTQPISAAAPQSAPPIRNPQSELRNFPAPPDLGDDATATDLLRQIARLLKAQNADLGDFSYAKMCAALAQMLTLGCALFGLFHLQQPAIFMQWFLAAILMQLFVIVLLFVVKK